MPPRKSNTPSTKRLPLSKDWHRFQHLDWYESDTSDLMYQTIIPINDEISLCVEAGGNPNNPPLLLIMGLGSQLIFWTENFIKRLIDAGFFVIRFDNRDIGLSSKIEPKTPKRINIYSTMFRFAMGMSNDKVPTAYNLFDMAEDTATMIKALGFAKVNVLGASMGGMIAQILSARYPHLVEKLALLFTADNRPFSTPPRPKQFKTLLSKPVNDSKVAVVQHSNHFIYTIGSSGFTEDELINMLSETRFERDYSPLGSARQFHAIITTGSILDYSRAIAAPTLILHGSKDGLIPVSNGRALSKVIKNSKYVEIKGMAHDLPDYFQPFIVNELSKFILNA